MANPFNVDFFPLSEMRRISKIWFRLFYDRVFRDGKDKDGKQFDSYSTQYADYISNDMRTFGRGPNKAGAGRKLKGFKGTSLKYDSRAQKLTKRMPVMLGVLRSNLRIKGYDKDDIKIGFDGEPAEIAQYLKDQGRDFISDIPDKEFDRLVLEIGSSVDKEFKKIRHIKVEISI